MVKDTPMTAIISPKDKIMLIRLLCRNLEAAYAITVPRMEAMTIGIRGTESSVKIPIM
jgi:hypothetical protein